MSTTIVNEVQTKVYTTPDGRVVIEQSNDSIMSFSADQIIRVIRELHVCYDYCAAWKETTPQEIAVGTEAQRTDIEFISALPK